MNLLNLTASEMAEKLQKKEFSSVALTQVFVDEINANEKNIGAFNKMILEDSISKARTIDAYRDGHKPGPEDFHPVFESANEKVLEGLEQVHPLAGVPIAISDDIVTKTIETTADLDVLSGFVPDFDSHIFWKIKAAGLPFIGKTKTGKGCVQAVANNELPWGIAIDTAGNVEDFAKDKNVVVKLIAKEDLSTYGVLSTAPEKIKVAVIARNQEDADLLADFLFTYKAPGEK